MLDLVPHEEVVDEEAQPACGEYGHGDEDLADETNLLRLEDVKDTPHGDDDAEEVNDFCQHD